MSPHRRSVRVSLGQVVIAEVTVVGLVVASLGPGWLLLSAVTAAAAVGVATFGRAGGRWWYQAVASQRRFARRRRRAASEVVIAALDARTPPTTVWLRTLAPDLTVRAVTIGDRSIAVAADGAGWFAAAALTQTGPATDGTALTQAGPFTDGTAFTDGSATAATYEIEGVRSIEPDLLADMLTPGADRVELSTAAFVRRGRHRWVALRLSPVDAVGLDPGRMEAVVAAGLVRATRVLGEAGYEAVPLDPEALAAALVTANGLDAAPQEHWAGWSSGRLEHATYEASGVPPDGYLPGAFAVALSVGRISRDRRTSQKGQLPQDQLRNGRLASRAGTAPEEVGLTGVLVRVAARPGELTAACRAVVRAADRVGVDLRRLDGDQAPAAYACGPTALPGNAIVARSASSPRIMAGRRDH